MLLVEIEHPANLKPNGLGISLGEGFIDVLGDAGEHLRIPLVAGSPFEEIHFVEDVQSVDVTGAVKFFLLFEEDLLNLTEKRIFRVEEPASVFGLEAVPFGHFLDGGLRVEFLELGGNMAIEGRKDRFHPQFPFAAEDFLLKFFLSVYILLRQRAVPAVDVHHPVPRQERRAGEALAGLVGRNAEMLPDLEQDALLAGDVQRHSHAVEGHPVNHMFPLLPAPPRHGVSVGAVVEEESVFRFRFYGDLLRHFRKYLRHPQRVCLVPADCRQTAVLQIPVQAHGH